MNAIISIIVPIHNGEKHLEECLKSIKMQDFQDFEVILVDDASNDQTQKICQKFSRLDQRFKYFYLEKNVGAAKARQYGIMESEGDFIGFVDADDIVSCNMYDSLFYAMTRDDSDIAVVSYIEFHDNHDAEDSQDVDVNAISGRDISSRPSTNTITGYEQIVYLYKKEYGGFLWNKLYKRTIIDKYCINFDDVTVGEDLLFNLRFLEYSRCMSIIQEHLYYYRNSDKSLSHCLDANWFSILKVHKEILSMSKEWPADINTLVHNWALLVIINAMARCKMMKIDYSTIEQKYGFSYSSVTSNIHLSSILRNPYMTFREKCRAIIMIHFPKLLASRRISTYQSSLINNEDDNQ